MTPFNHFAGRIPSQHAATCILFILFFPAQNSLDQGKNRDTGQCKQNPSDYPILTIAIGQTSIGIILFNEFSTVFYSRVITWYANFTFTTINDRNIVIAFSVLVPQKQ
jgi:hypothetical protein